MPRVNIALREFCECPVDLCCGKVQRIEPHNNAIFLFGVIFGKRKPPNGGKVCKSMNFFCLIGFTNIREFQENVQLENDSSNLEHFYFIKNFEQKELVFIKNSTKLKKSVDSHSTRIIQWNYREIGNAKIPDLKFSKYGTLFMKRGEIYVIWWVCVTIRVLEVGGIDVGSY